ncbi:MAG: EAL domain-containing protein [Oscillatoriales cyanobacterium RM2_1_1]|nr:EAL domain-containing protein [Oscillatoriales cyanobacterium SM2_3_0]NJO45953.1 EAL domain-containing protein [Oscillatoriales cyanobacterium RM2_1_1]
MTLSSQTSLRDHQAQADILIVDDTPENLYLLSEILVNQGYKVRKVLNGQLALNAIAVNPPDLILLDVMMPELNGYQVCEILKSDPETQEIPILFISALHEDLDKVKAFTLGGADYITKPFQVREVLARVRHQLELRAARIRIESLNTDLEHRILQRTAQLQEAQEKLMHMAFHDPLTNLPNRTAFLQQLEQALERQQIEPMEHFAVLYLDGDRFKLVNDSLGHLFGDKLLIHAAQRLQSCCRSTDMLARMGGDEFVLLVRVVDHAESLTISKTALEKAIEIARQIHQVFELPFNLEGHEISINFSIGICQGAGYDKFEDILRDADTALYRAKASGEDYYQVFDPTMYQQVVATLQIQQDLRRALVQEEFLVYYQPIVHLETLSLTGFEALVRWQPLGEPLIAPGQFIPIAEETGLIIPLGFWVLRTACRQLRQWQIEGRLSPSVTLSVNLSAKQLNLSNLVEQIQQILAETQLLPECLKLEITESAIMDHPENVIHYLGQLRKQGIQLSIDDFGTGYSSLAYLNRLPLNILKIDRSFVIGLTETIENQGIAKAIIALAQTLGMQTIAEGVETQAQVDQLKQLGCDMGQGYLFSRPLPVESLETWLN